MPSFGIKELYMNFLIIASTLILAAAIAVTSSKI